MAIRGKELMKQVLNKVGENNMTPAMKESLEKSTPDSKGNWEFMSLVFGKYLGFCLLNFGVVTRKAESSSKVLVDPWSRSTWKPNVQEKRLFSYILDRYIRVKFTPYALRCISKAGGIDEYLLKTPYKKMETELGLVWKSKIEKMYEELGKVEVAFFSPEGEAKFEQSFKDLKLSEREARRQFRQQMYAGLAEQKKAEEGRSYISFVLASSDDYPDKLVANF
ncbi:54S ribosomal protein L24, mitochondrial [Manihot esculenta]|uniref:54S ribosomal protein L24, mitochondrial n=1 Tax=Manihot esculenta TaxID=3983 RepID=UPI000B5D28F5|nr:54S ribosomal protein L24, mitochondrial [Manihot esculenta]